MGIQSSIGEEAGWITTLRLLNTITHKDLSVASLPPPLRQKLDAIIVVAPTTLR